MHQAEIEKNVQQLIKSFNQDTFIYDLLLAYGQPKASIKRLQVGNLNLSKETGVIDWKKNLYYKVDVKGDLHELIDDLKENEKVKNHSPRFIIVTDYETLLAIDTKTNDPLDIPIKEIAKHFDFFLPWAGMEKAQHKSENPADVKAAERMAKLYDEIKKDNTTHTQEEVHNLNVFLSRLLFCFFAEDTGIFEEKQFTHAISNHTQQDGSDLNTYLDRLFQVMNTEPGKRKNLPAYLEAFPYVNGGLFRDKRHAPHFTRGSRHALIESGGLDWSAINPDIFGSMIQAVITPEHRGSLGMHYTSVPNIMKVIEPLFLNDLKEEFEAADSNAKKLNALLHRIWNIKIFDPACGSGNFLIIAYKVLRRLEMQIFKALNSLAYSEISLGNFYGIEIDDFAHEVATLSLWLAEHQMNQEFLKEFKRTKPALPLKETGNIIQGNATRINWETVCPKNESDEIYILGNPPYLGSRRQDESQKEDLKLIFGKEYKSLDYIAAWFYNGAKYIRNSMSQCAFVSTNSVCQGEQVSITWQRILNSGVEISFAHKDFKWSNNAKYNAGVTVVIIGLSAIEGKKKYLFIEGIRKSVKEINPYLVEGSTLYIHSRQTPVSLFPEMNFGNMPADGGKLLFTPEEKNNFISKAPETAKFFKKLISADEFLNGKERWCLWLEEYTLKELDRIPSIKKIVAELKIIRQESSRPQLADIPHLFAQITQPEDKDYILIPRHSSENREYIPIGYFSSDNKAHDSCLIVPTNEIYLFGILTAKIHMVWVHSICGRLETRYRYSKDVVYNNYPFPKISDSQKKEMEKHVLHILEEREKYSEKTLAQLYDPEKMPQSLRDAHRQNDIAVEMCYRSKPFENDEERLEFLFKLYEKMKNDDDNSGTLFAKPVKPRKK